MVQAQKESLVVSSRADLWGEDACRRGTAVEKPPSELKLFLAHAFKFCPGLELLSVMLRLFLTRRECPRIVCESGNPSDANQ